MTPKTFQQVLASLLTAGIIANITFAFRFEARLTRIETLLIANGHSLVKSNLATK